MADINRMKRTIDETIAAETPQQPPAETPRPAGNRLGRMQSLITQGVVEDLQTNGPPEIGESDSIGALGAEAPTFADSYKAGVRQMQSTYDYGAALVNYALGDIGGYRQNIEDAQVRDRVTAGLMSGGTELTDLLEDPTIGGGLQFAKQTLGQMAPMALESVTAGLIGSALAPGVGTVAGLGGHTAVRAMLRMTMRNSLKNIAKGQAREVDDNVLSGLLRNQAKQRAMKYGALAGAGAVEYMHGAGEAFRETVEAGDPSPGRAAAMAAPYAALGMVSDKLVIDTLGDAVRAADGPTKHALKSILSGIGKHAGAEGATEAGQEEILIQLRDSLTEEDYASSDEADMRRLQAGAAGAIAGGARGGITSSVATTIESLRDGGQGVRNSMSNLRDSVNATLDSVQGEANPSRDMRIESDTVLPEPQRDIDAQFDAMMNEASAKRAVEITQDSPLPSSYRKGEDGVIAVGTKNGQLLTRDSQLAADVANNRVSVREALGYGADKRADMTRAAVARDEQGNVVHSELLDPNESDESALARVRRMAPNAEIMQATDSIRERADRLRAEGRNPELEGARIRMRNTEEQIAQKAQSLETLKAGRRDPKLVNRWKEIDQVIPRLEQQLKVLQNQQQQQSRQIADLQAREDNKTDLQRERAETDAILRDVLNAAVSEDPNSGGIEVANTRTGEQRTIPQEAFKSAVEQFRERDPSATDFELHERVADEFESRGYSVNRTDARPIPVREINRADIEALEVSAGRLAYDDPATYRNADANRGGRVQVIRRKHRLGPQTAAVEVDGHRVPKSALKQLRELRNRFPEDDWSLAKWYDDKNIGVYQVQRERALSERQADDPVVRNVDNTDSDALEMTRSGTPDGTDTVANDPAMSQGAIERVLQATEKARLKDNRKKPGRHYHLKMTDPQGRVEHYNPNIIANAGMDANQYLVGNPEITQAERKQIGFNTAMAILLERGYIPDWNTAGKYKDNKSSRRPQRSRHSRPEYSRYSGMWQNMQLGERQQVTDDAGIELSTNQLIDSSLADLNKLAKSSNRAFTQEHFEALLATLDERRESSERDEPDYSRQEERFNPRNFTNRDTSGVKTFAQYNGDSIDPVLSPTLREMVADAKRESGIYGGMTVLTDKTSSAMLQSLPTELREQITTDPNVVGLLGGEHPKNLRGRTTFFGDHAVIWVNTSMRGDMQALALAHEMGHVAFRQHQTKLEADQKRYRRLRKEFEADQSKGHVKQYDDPALGFEEWFADRFAAWLHGRTENDDLPRHGLFRDLYKTLRGIARRLRVTAAALARAGNPALQTRIRESAAFSDFMTGVVRAAPYRNRAGELRRQRFDNMVSERDDHTTEIAYRQIKAELDGRTLDAGVPKSLIGAISKKDPVAEIQGQRIFERSVDGYSNEPSYTDYTDPAPAQQFEPEPEATPQDPAPAQRFDANIRDDRGEDIAPAQRFEPEPETASADPAPAQTFERRPAEGGSGDGGKIPPTAGDGLAEPDGFDRDPLHDAMFGRARRWADTDTYKKLEQWIRRNLPNTVKQGFRALKDLTWTDDSRLREMGHYGVRLANLFYTPAGERHKEKGWHNAVESELAYWMEESEKVLPNDPDRAEEVLREAQSSTADADLSPEAQKIRQFLKRFYTQYASKNIRGIKRRKDYFPRAYDMSEIIARPEEFSRVLQNSGHSEKEAAGIVRAMMEGESTVELTTEDQEGSGPGMSARLQRQLEKLDDTELRNRGFLLEPRAALMGYLRSAVRRGEYERRFGGETALPAVIADLRERRQRGQWIDEDFYQSMLDLRANAKRPNEIMIYDPSQKIKALISKMEAGDRAKARQIVQNYMGRSNSLFGVQMPPSIARGISAISGVMYMATLGLSTISQITDFGAMVLRTRGPEGLGMLREAMLKVPREERVALARAVGSISHEANREALRLSYGNDFMTPGVRRAVDTFFKVIGLEAMTNYSRSVATAMGSEFLQMHAKEAGFGSLRSQRYLDELGVTRQQVNEWVESGYNFESQSGNAVRQALFQFTDESILRPNAAMRPGWASNPWFTLAWQLKSFAWGFYKVVVKGLANEVIQRHREGAPVTSQIAPMALAAGTLFPLAFLTMGLRDVAKEGLNAAFDDDEYEWNIDKERNAAQWMLELSDRSGLLGPWSLVNSAFDAYSWGDSPVLSMAGPAFENAGRLVDGDVERVANDLVPVAGLVR